MIIFYLVLFLSILIPTLFKKKTFVYYIIQSLYKFPKVIVESILFIYIIKVLNYIWGILFLFGAYLYISYSDISFSGMVEVVILFTGILSMILVPKYIIKNNTKKIRFTSMQDAFLAMPFNLNKNFSKGIDVVIQFILDGEESSVSHFIIRDNKCKHYYIKHVSPTLTIFSNSKLWLDIINGDIDGTDAYINKKYTMQGDTSIMRIFKFLFDPRITPIKIKEDKKTYDYKVVNQNSIKNIVVFDGGVRKKKFSKTMFMVNNFLEGAVTEGANIKVFKLVDFDIHHCNGCLTCWSKTPGVCIHKDNMETLLQFYRNADLIIFASPLYAYNVTGIMKNFMDRLLPLKSPYICLEKDKDDVSLDVRFPEDKHQGFVIFSAGGFPKVANNFDGLSGMYRAWDYHTSNIHLLGEFFLTSSELITQPIYQDRKNSIKEACFEAGMQVVREGKIDYKYMSKISTPVVSYELYQEHTNKFWDKVVGKKAYLREIEKFENSDVKEIL